MQGSSSNRAVIVIYWYLFTSFSSSTSKTAAMTPRAGCWDTVDCRQSSGKQGAVVIVIAD